MHRMSHNRFDVEAWMNINDDIEIKVYDHRTHRCIAHAILREPETIEEDTYYMSLWSEDWQNIAETDSYEVTLKRFVDIDRDVPDVKDGSDVENTLYWNLNSEGFNWSRHPLWSWQSMIGSGEFYEVEFAYGKDTLDTVFEELREEYMDEVEDEVSKIAPN